MWICGAVSLESAVHFTGRNDLLLIFVQEIPHGIKLTNSIL